MRLCFLHEVQMLGLLISVFLTKDVRGLLGDAT